MPEVDGLFRGAGEEESGVESVPDHGVDGGDVSVVGHDEGGRVLGGAQVDVALVRPDQIERVVVRLEGNRPHTVPHPRVVLLHVGQSLGEVHLEKIRVPEGGFHDGPVSDSTVPRATEEI